MPSSDGAFAAAVGAALDDDEVASPDELERRVRPWAPNVVVRSRELSGETGSTWYVYRDGRFAANEDVEWHAAPETAWARFDSATGLVLQANESFCALVGYEERDIIGRPYQDFVFREAVELASRVYDAIILTGRAHSVVRLRRRDGSGVTVEYVARAGDGSVDGWYRPVALAAGRR